MANTSIATLYFVKSAN